MNMLTTSKRQLLLFLLVALSIAPSANGFSVLLPHQACRTVPPPTLLYATEIDYTDDAAFDQSVDAILDAMYASSDRGMKAKAREFEDELQHTHAQTFWLTRIVNAWARSPDVRAVENAEFVLQEMKNLFQVGYDYVKPNTVTYNSVINCLAHSKDSRNAAERSEELIKEMWHLVETRENSFVRPSTITYSSVIKAWSKSDDYKNKGERAEALLRNQWHRYQLGNDKCKPDGRTYNNVVATWAHSKSNIGYERAKALVDEMWTLYNQEQDKEMKPNKVTMTFLLTSLAYASRNDPDAAKKADELVEEMWRLSKTQSDMKPNAIIYTTLIQVWTANRDRDAVNRVQALLNEMKERFYENGEPDFRPSLSAYALVMEKLVHAPLPDSADRAEALLQELWNRTDSGETFVHPNVDVYHFALQARARSKQRDAVEQAERLLYEMIARYRAGDRRVMPNVEVFTSILKAHANRRNMSCDPDKIQTLLEEMYKLQKEGVRRVAPDRKSMTTVMDLLTRKHERQCLLKAEEVLETMWKNAVGTGRPDSVTYLTIMSAWTKSREHDAVDRAEALYQDLWKRYDETGNKKVKPDTVVCNAMMTAYARSRRDDAVEKAQEIFDDMVRRHADGDSNIGPDTVSHNSLLNAMAKSKRAGSAEKAEEILRSMWREEAGNVKPNIVTISTVIDAWSHAKTPESPKRAQALLEEACERYKAGDETVKPNAFTYTPVVLAWSVSQDPKGPFKAEATLKRMCEEEIYPNKIVYGHVISSFGKLKSKEGAEHAEALLREQWKKLDAGYTSLKPDTIGCNTVIMAWANSQAEEAPERAQAILNEMLDRAGKGDRYVKPTRITYNAVLSVWSKSGRKDGAQQAQNLIEDLWNRHAKDNRIVCPDRINYINVMFAWARSGDEAVEKASAVMQTLWKRFEEGNNAMKPDSVAYASMMQVYLNSERHDTYDKAKEMIQEMKDRDVEFSTRLFGTYIKVLGTRPGTNDEIEGVFREMEQLSDQGKDCKPDTFLYNTALTNLARATEENGLKQAHTLLEKMWQRFEDTNDKQYKPDIISYTSLMRAHRRCGSGNDEIQKLVDEVHRRYEQGDSSFAPNHSLERIKTSLLENESTDESITLEVEDTVWIDDHGIIHYDGVSGAMHESLP